ncbi:hypothetical protein, partial [Bradyrhizobium sp.]|uniref:hypothetical protein n=1 Tax=Bradyrhizobium sp. TaxID=376 RepID=UPI00391D85E7
GPAWRAAAVAGAAGLVARMRAATSGFTDAARETPHVATLLRAPGFLFEKEMFPRVIASVVSQ